MKNIFIISSCVLLSLSDVAVTTVLVILSSGGSLADGFYNYAFGTSSSDVWVLSLIRTCLVLGFLIGVCCNSYEGIKRVKKLKRFFVYLAVALELFVIIKLLYYSEDSKKNLKKNAIVALFATSAFFNIALYFQWLLINAANVRSLQSYGLSIQKDSNDAERESLLSNTNSDSESDSEASEGSGSDSDSENRQEKSNTSAVAKLLMYAKPDTVYILLALLALIASSVCEIYLPFYIGQIINSIAIDKSEQKFKNAIFMMTMLSVAAGIFAGFRGGMFDYVMARYTIRLQNLLFSCIIKQEIGFFDMRKTGAITSRLTADTTKVGDDITHNINIFLRSSIKMIGILVFMFKLSWRLTIVTLVGTPILVIISEAYGEYYQKLSEQVQSSLAEANESAEEAISSVRTVRSFAAEGLEIDRYKDKLKMTYRLKIKEAFASGGYNLLNEVSFLGMEVLLLFYGGHLVIRGDLTGGHLVSFVIYDVELGGAIEDIGNIFTSLMEAVGASRKVFEFIEREPKIRSDGNAKPPKLSGSVEFRNVNFSYPSRPDIQVIKDLSFKVSPGEIVALVGPSGGGKSTVVSLLERFYDPQSGEVLVDGRPVQEYEHLYYHKRVALVAQEPTLFARTVSENIKYGLYEDVPDENVKSMAELANAHQFISDMPEGYETQAGEKGIQLSGGQKQRVAIARALIRNPSLLILDEATSALDAESEYQVQEAINRNLSNRTVIIIAHRLSTIEKATKILVVEKGQIVEEGSHMDLMNKGGTFAKLIKKQLMSNSPIESAKDIDIEETGVNRSSTAQSSSPQPESTGLLSVSFKGLGARHGLKNL